MPISDLWDKVVDHFSTPASLARIEIMTQSASQVEGWFKAEMMLLLKCLREDGILDSWNREVLTGRGREKMDFDVRFGTERAVIEMKAVFCGEQKGTLYRLSSYGTLGGDIHRDVLKISGVRMTPKSRHYFLLVSAYPAQSRDEWELLIQKISARALGDLMTLLR